MSHYQHSYLFAVLKRRQETFTGNLTSLQYLQTLDYLLWNALDPIIKAAPLLWLNYCGKVVARQTLRSAAKFTSDDKRRLPIMLHNCVALADNPTKLAKLSRKFYFNRGVLFGFLSVIGAYFKDYLKACDCDPSFSEDEGLELIAKVQASYGCIYPALKSAFYWEKKAIEFKQCIVEKYTRLALNHAQATYVECRHIIPLDDVISVYVITTNRAIDRCDARLGVLTTFVVGWYKSAKSEVQRQVQHALAMSIDSMTDTYGDAAVPQFGVDELDTTFEDISHLAEVSREIDPVGLITYHLGVMPKLSESDRKVLHLLSIKEEA